MLIFRGKLEWYEWAVNEGVTVLIPLSIHVGDPIYMYFQWTRDPHGHVLTKFHDIGNSIIDKVYSPTKFHYYTERYYRFEATLLKNNTQLSIEMLSRAGPTSGPFILHRVLDLQPSIKDPLYPSLPAPRVYVGKMNYFKYAVDELFVIICPGHINKDSEVCAFWQWTIDAKGKAKGNMDYKARCGSIANGPHGIKFKLSQGYYSFDCEINEDADELKVIMKNPQGGSQGPFILPLQDMDFAQGTKKRRPILHENIAIENNTSELVICSVPSDNTDTESIMPIPFSMDDPLKWVNIASTTTPITGVTDAFAALRPRTNQLLFPGDTVAKTSSGGWYDPTKELSIGHVFIETNKTKQQVQVGKIPSIGNGLLKLKDLFDGKSQNKMRNISSVYLSEEQYLQCYRAFKVPGLQPVGGFQPVNPSTLAHSSPEKYTFSVINDGSRPILYANSFGHPAEGTQLFKNHPSSTFIITQSGETPSGPNSDYQILTLPNGEKVIKFVNCTVRPTGNQDSIAQKLGTCPNESHVLSVLFKTPGAWAYSWNVPSGQGTNVPVWAWNPKVLGECEVRYMHGASVYFVVHRLNQVTRQFLQPLIDPAIKSLVCEFCWSTIFSVDGWKSVLAAKQVPNRTGYSKGYVYKNTWEAIRAAAPKCNWCRFLSRPEPTGEVEIWAACDENSDCTPAGEKKLTVVTQGHFSFQQYYMYTSNDDKASKYVKARDRITDVTTPEAYKLAIQCFDNCVRTHESCPKPSPTILPDRVIDCSNIKKAKIVLTGGTQKGLYVTLSYVWGGSQPVTKTDNIDKYVAEGFDVSKFPQTIQDAIAVTHNLGQRYLWIDALCIIQDSPKDIARQLGMMRNIYRNSYFTINAACASGANEGFLYRSRPTKFFNAQVPYRCPDGTTGSIWLAASMDTDITDGSHSYFDEIEPVTYRGWCMQERLLPPRSFVYAKDTLKLFCQTETVNIGNALCEPSTGMRLPNAVYQPSKRTGPISDKEKITNRQAWLAAVFTYTLREITDPSDKFVAMAGIAEQFHDVYNDQYLVGLWQKTLTLDLLWRSERATTRPKDYRAPSWSWASVDGLVSVKYREEELSTGSYDVQKVEIQECKVTLDNELLPFGKVTDGILKLMGFLKEVVLKSKIIVLIHLDKNQEPVEIGTINQDADEVLSGPLCIIPIIWDSRGAMMEGLLVVSVSNERYRRVGAFTGSKEAAKYIIRRVEERLKQGFCSSVFEYEKMIWNRGNQRMKLKEDLYTESPDGVDRLDPLIQKISHVRYFMAALNF